MLVWSMIALCARLRRRGTGVPPVRPTGILPVAYTPKMGVRRTPKMAVPRFESWQSVLLRRRDAKEWRCRDLCTSKITIHAEVRVSTQAKEVDRSSPGHSGLGNRDALPCCPATSARKSCFYN